MKGSSYRPLLSRPAITCLRTTLCLALFSSLIVLPAAGQASNTVGLMLGEGVTQFRGAENFDQFQLGPSIGVVATFQLTPRVGLRTGLVYIEKGGTGEQGSLNYDNNNVAFDVSDVTIADGDENAGREANMEVSRLIVSGVDVDATLAVDYIQLPLMVDFYLPVGTGIRPRLSVGGFMSYSAARSLDFELGGDYDASLSGTIRFADGGSDTFEYNPADPDTDYPNTFDPIQNPSSLAQFVGRDVVLDADNAVKQLDYGVSVGGAVQFDLREQPVAIGLRYDFGLATISDPDSFPSIVNLGDLQAKTSVITLNLETRFRW